MAGFLAYAPLFGKPIIFWGGILTFLSLLLTMSISIAAKRGWKWIPFQYHPVMAFVTLLLAIGHASLGLLMYFFGI